jgi:hypothetical protein
MEVTFETRGKFVGIDASDVGTYWTVVQANGALYGEGEGFISTEQGDVVQWVGTRRGRLTKQGGASFRGAAVTYPIIGDHDLEVAKAYDMLPEEAGTSSHGRTAADNATERSVFVIGPDKKVKAMLTYPMSTGRNFDEVLRLLDSCQLTAKHKVATPVNWKQGQDVIIVPAVSDDDAKKTFPGGWRAPKPCMRIVPQPK